MGCPLPFPCLPFREKEGRRRQRGPDPLTAPRPPQIYPDRTAQLAPGGQVDHASRASRPAPSFFSFFFFLFHSLTSKQAKKPAGGRCRSVRPVVTTCLLLAAHNMASVRACGVHLGDFFI